MFSKIVDISVPISNIRDNSIVAISGFNMANTPEYLVLELYHQYTMKGQSPQSITSGTGPDDPLAGKLFDTGEIKSKGYVEFVTANLNPGAYSYYSTINPSFKGLINVHESTGFEKVP